MAKKQRLIDLDANLDRLNKEKWMRSGAETSVIRMFLNKAKIVDAVEVVRCEKCRYYEKAEYDDGYKMVCRLLKRQTAYNGFCYCGAKMDGGNEDA